MAEGAWWDGDRFLYGVAHDDLEDVKQKVRSLRRQLYAMQSEIRERSVPASAELKHSVGMMRDAERAIDGALTNLCDEEDRQ